MSSGTTAEPIQPEAPVTKMRMEGLLGCAADEEDASGAGAAAGTVMRSSRIDSTTPMRLSRIASQVMRSDRVA
jgi:hypothetical protein